MSRATHLSELLWDAADRRPDGLAVIDDERRVSYGELASRTARLANLLRDLGAGPGTRIAVHLAKSTDAVVALYGILAAGAAYVPLDPGAPPARTAAIVRDCDVRLVITEPSRIGAAGALRAAGAPLETLVVPGSEATPAVDAPSGLRIVDGRALEAQAATPPTPRATASDPAYILYTSGSTGTPKGVVHTHASALAFVDWAATEFDVSDGDRLASHAPLHFDLSVFDLYAAAYGAAVVVLVPRAASMFPIETRRFIERHHITVWYSVPSILAALAERAGLVPGDLASVRLVLFAGEVFPTRQLRALMAGIPGARFANLYGPTETNVCTWYEVPLPPADATEPIPIGAAIPGVNLLVLRDDGAEARAGEIGEAYVHGATVMQGYWSAPPERTGSGLVPHPTRGGESAWYRTGDLVEVVGDGTLRFRGRRDAQVKHRGYRVELGEIEVVLATDPAVRACAVVALADERAGSKLVAYIVGDDADPAELRRACAQRLPRYMIPDQIERVSHLPYTSTGKIDRRALATTSVGGDPEP